MPMEKITFEDYKKIVLVKFREVQHLDKTSLLQNMTPASIRRYCVLLVSQNLSSDDEKTLRAYFNIAPEMELGKGIEHFELGKLKSLISFLKADKDSHNNLRTELAAILADFELRPYSRYLKVRGAMGRNSGAEIKSTVVNEGDAEILNPAVINQNFLESSLAITKHKVRNRFYLVGLTLIIMCISILAVKKVLTPECLQWNDDHFDIVNCDGHQQGFVFMAPILKYDEKLLKLRMIEVTDSTTYFKNGVPIVYYLKKNGKCEFFNASGIHPVYDKPLKPVTQYIVNKYGRK